MFLDVTHQLVANKGTQRILRNAIHELRLSRDIVGNLFAVPRPIARSIIQLAMCFFVFLFGRKISQTRIDHIFFFLATFTLAKSSSHRFDSANIVLPRLWRIGKSSSQLLPLPSFNSKEKLSSFLIRRFET